MNCVNLVGRLCRDTELRYTAGGTAVTDNAVAIKAGKDKTDFIPVTFWSKSAELLAEYSKKGDLIGVEGRITSDAWETDDGQKRSKVFVTASRVEFLTKKEAEAKAEAKSEVNTECDAKGEPAEEAVGEKVPF